MVTRTCDICGSEIPKGKLYTTIAVTQFGKEDPVDEEQVFVNSSSQIIKRDICEACEISVVKAIKQCFQPRSK